MLRILNIILTLVILFLLYMLWQSLRAPVRFQKQVEERHEAVHNKMYLIRDAQEAFKGVTLAYAPDFDTLAKVLKTGNYEFKNRVTGEVTKKSILDSLFKGDASAVNSLSEVPYSKKQFEMGSGVLPSPSDSTVYIPVFEVSTMTDTYLGGENGVNDKYWYKGKKVKLGSLTAPKLTGNWE